MISAYRKPTYTNVNKTDGGEREQVGESGNGKGKMRNGNNVKNWKQTLLRGCNLKSLRLLKIEKKTVHAFSHIRGLKDVVINR